MIFGTGIDIVETEEGRAETGDEIERDVKFRFRSGLAVNLLKGLIGRPRPNMLVYYDLSPFAFDPMSFAGQYSSFPSGHATTVAAITTWTTITA